MQIPDPQFDIGSEADLLRLFDAPSEVSIAKEIDHIDANYGAWIAASPFFVMCTAGPDGLDASPRGDAPGFVEVADPKTLFIPDRRGNNRIDSLRNLVTDPRIALLFLIPGLGETLRVNGRVRLSTDPATRARFEFQGKTPKVVLVMSVETVYFQCSRAVVRGDLWNAAKHVARESLPTAGQILSEVSAGKVDGDKYDRELPARLKTTLY
jgi:PPOX class probable FMN-dependent enzyme